MNYYTVSDEYYFRVASTTKGLQVKYLKDGYFYKLNKQGNEALALLSSASERLEYILDIIESLGFPRQDYRNYMQILMQLDLLAENCDRHVHNYGLIFKYGNFRLLSVFDNGLSLRINQENHPVSCTLSGSFIEQVTVFGFPVEPAFLVHYDTLLPELENIRLVYGSRPEIQVLENNLQEYKNIFVLKNTGNKYHVRKFECF